MNDNQLNKKPLSFKRYSTQIIIAVILVGWGLLVACNQDLPIVAIFLLGTIITCWFGSLQHELVHGHPFKYDNLNRLVGMLPIGLFTPFPLYKKYHLEHHQITGLTQPGVDPESFYVFDSRWESYPEFIKTILIANNTLLGRMLFGPSIALYRFYRHEMRLLLKKDFTHLGYWIIHLALVAFMFMLLSHFSISPLSYILLFAYPGYGLTLVRSFYEHRPAEKEKEKCAIVETNLFFQYLFLNNSYHAVHHRFPGMPWWQLKDYYHQHKAHVLADGAYLVKGYQEIFKRYFLKPKDNPVYQEKSFA